MNAIVIGANKSPILECVPSGNFLFIDDGPLIDALQLFVWNRNAAAAL
jgi:hypothetical protein